jgi:hypothetical protein
MSYLIDAIRQNLPFGKGKKLPGRKHRLVSERKIAGPNSGADIRMYMDAESLAKLLDIARSSAAQRVQMNNVGLLINKYQAEDGHTYECWSLISGTPIPERVPLVDGLTK